ncbi:hypothetical protein NQZ68_026990 [Dissostichus eleginoides]|nr:hypothetical protein NQZ68_026990 [Dissostichus eleginoides]
MIHQTADPPPPPIHPLHPSPLRESRGADRDSTSMQLPIIGMKKGNFKGLISSQKRGFADMTTLGARASLRYSNTRNRTAKSSPISARGLRVQRLRCKLLYLHSPSPLGLSTPSLAALLKRITDCWQAAKAYLLRRNVALTTYTVANTGGNPCLSEALYAGSFSQTASLSSGHCHKAFLTSLALDADCKNKNSAPKVISLREMEGGGKEEWRGRQIDKSRSLWLPLFFVAVSVETMFRRLVAAGHGNQEATNPPEAMAQPYTPAQYPPPPQNGIPAEFAAPHPLPTQDYSGQSRVPEHAMTLYTPTQTHSEPAGTDNSTPAITATTTAPVSVLHHLQTLFSTRCQQRENTCWEGSRKPRDGGHGEMRARLTSSFMLSPHIPSPCPLSPYPPHTPRSPHFHPSFLSGRTEG